VLRNKYTIYLIASAERTLRCYREEEEHGRVRGRSLAAKNDSNGEETLKTLSSGERYINRAGWNRSVIYKLRS